MMSVFMKYEIKQRAVLVSREHIPPPTPTSRFPRLIRERVFLPLPWVFYMLSLTVCML